MSSDREEVLRFGANQIRGYVGGDLTLSITPTSVLLPHSEVDHLNMPITMKDKDVAADTLVFSNNDSTHAQTIAASGDLTVSAAATVTVGAALVANSVKVPAPTGGTATAISIYEETATSNHTVGGCFADATLTISFTRINNVVMMHVLGLTHAAENAATIYTGPSAVPARFAPTNATTYVPFTVLNNSAYIAGTAWIKTDGAIVLYTAGSGNFANTGNAGCASGTVCWKL